MVSGAIVRLEGRDDEGRPIFALAAYEPPEGWTCHVNLVMRRDYAACYQWANELD